MFTEFFGSPSRIQKLREGHDGHLLEGFASGGRAFDSLG